GCSGSLRSLGQRSLDSSTRHLPVNSPNQPRSRWTRVPPRGKKTRCEPHEVERAISVSIKRGLERHIRKMLSGLRKPTSSTRILLAREDCSLQLTTEARS